MNKKYISYLRRINFVLQLIITLLISPFFFPHIVLFEASKMNRRKIIMDIERNQNDLVKRLTMPEIKLLWFLRSNRYFRSLFYFRIGRISKIISWICPGDRYFILSNMMHVGGGMSIAHPYATVINATKIGDFFSVRNCTTIGINGNSKPCIGDNVTLGVGVTIVGGVHIGNNVIIGAGAVVVKDLPDNCIAAGNPARVIRFLDD